MKAGSVQPEEDIERVVSSDAAGIPGRYRKTVSRVTSDLVLCSVRLVATSYVDALLPVNYLGFSERGLNTSELGAAKLYAARGYKVIRLEHAASSGVGSLEDVLPDSKRLGEVLRKHWDRSCYEHFIVRSAAVAQELTLNAVYPADYPISCYPPDFLMIRTPRDFRFVEVKGPRDKLHFRQANWLSRLIPAEWPYEICAVVGPEVTESEVLIELPRQSTPKFEAKLDAEDMECARFREMISGAKR